MLADLGALEVMPAVQARAQDKVSLQERAGARENVQNFVLNRIHTSTLAAPRLQDKFAVRISIRKNTQE
jgi:hypothetical protein